MAFKFIFVFDIHNFPSLANLTPIIEKENEALGS